MTDFETSCYYKDGKKIIGAEVRIYNDEGNTIDRILITDAHGLEELETKLSNNVNGSNKTVAFFYISSNGYVNVRKPGDYLSKMIEMAGGRYALENLQLEEENALSTININWEDFYREAKDADILIYNGTIDGGVHSIDELISKNQLFENFKAVKDGNVWSTDLDMFQETSKISEIVQDFYSVINEENANPEFLQHLD